MNERSQDEHDELISRLRKDKEKVRPAEPVEENAPVSLEPVADERGAQEP